MRTTYGLLLIVTLLAGASDAPAQPYNVKVVGSKTHTRHRDLGPFSSTANKDFKGYVTAGVNAHGNLDGAANNGIKARYIAVPGPPSAQGFTVNSGTASATGTACTPPLPACTASGSTSVTGTWVREQYFFRLGADDTFIWNLAPGPHTGADAWYVGDAWDPWPMGEGGMTPIDPDEPLWGFDFGLDDETELQVREDASFTARFTSLIADNVATGEVDTFRAANPALIYDVSFGAIGLNYWVDITYGSPTGFPITFSASEAQAEAALLQALQSGWTGDLSVLQGTIDIRGHQSVTFGSHSHAQAAVPEPASLIPIGLGVLMLLRRKKRTP